MLSTITGSPISIVFLNISRFNFALAIVLFPFADIFVCPLAIKIEYSFDLRVQNSFIGVPLIRSIYHKVCDLLENLRGENSF